MVQTLEKVFEATQNNNAIDAPKDFAESISEKFSAIFPSVPLMIATILAFIILFVVLYVFVRKPVKEMIKRRKDFIQNNIDESIKIKEEMIEKLNQVNVVLENANNQAESIVNRGYVRSEKIVIEYTGKAKNDAKQLLEEAHLDINKQQKEFKLKSRQIVAQTAKELAEKILKREISKESTEEIIEKFLDDTTPIKGLN
ncbi:F0F1 ATP synthase subunit B [Mycoplasmopsis sturni]|uniref:F0F1 ATP synthase subunit B n=1 Tax=Mycoplasmopsis sturni TaxID=39047 RepID=UPI0006920138|nr:F0F1 ATP synthase subunit B [Mycoplasmopsis sturni]